MTQLLWIMLLSLHSGLPQPTVLFHPIHLSVTEVSAEDAQSELNFSITFFMDDFGVAAKYPKYADAINTGKMTVDELILQHLQKHLKVKVNGKALKYKIKRKESNFPSVTCYLDLQKLPKELSTLEIENTLLLELFDDQKNMVHIRIPGKKQGSMILDHKKKSGLAKL
ncbi:MAG: DUF6702 family protein [Bacteroidota bacterium]